MPNPADGATGERVVAVARELFGRQGYKATTIAQIEAAAGLSPGAGGIYRHFAGKQALLQHVLTEQVQTGPDLSAFFRDVAGGADLRARMLAVARASLLRLDHERDLNRLLLRDLADFPELLAMVRDSELRRVHAALAHWLQENGSAGAFDSSAVATVLMGAISHYWIMKDVFGGQHPFQSDEDAFLEVLADMATSALSPRGAETASRA